MIGDHPFHLALAYGVSALLIALEVGVLWRQSRRQVASAPRSGAAAADAGDDPTPGPTSATARQESA